MAEENKMLVNKDNLAKIKSRANAIKVMTTDKGILQNISDILQIIDKEIEDNTLSILDKIEKKMKDSRRSDPEMHASLYILYRKLSDGKISEKEAYNLYNMYISTEPFDKKIY